MVIMQSSIGGLQRKRLEARSRTGHANRYVKTSHCFQPLLYQVATAALSPADVAWPIRSILSHQKNVRVVMTEKIFAGVERSRGAITTADQEFSFDYLILATGATHSYFGHDEWRFSAHGLKRIEDATDIRQRLFCWL